MNIKILRSGVAPTECTGNKHTSVNVERIAPILHSKICLTYAPLINLDCIKNYAIMVYHTQCVKQYLTMMNRCHSAQVLNPYAIDLYINNCESL